MSETISDCGNRISEREEVDMWDQPKGSQGTVSAAIRSYTAQWGLPTMACGHGFEHFIQSKNVCSRCGV